MFGLTWVERSVVEHFERSAMSLSSARRLIFRALVNPHPLVSSLFSDASSRRSKLSVVRCATAHTLKQWKKWRKKERKKNTITVAEWEWWSLFICLSICVKVCLTQSVLSSSLVYLCHLSTCAYCSTWTWCYIALLCVFSSAVSTSVLKETGYSLTCHRKKNTSISSVPPLASRVKSVSVRWTASPNDTDCGKWVKRNKKHRHREEERGRKRERERERNVKQFP